MAAKKKTLPPWLKQDDEMDAKKPGKGGMAPPFPAKKGAKKAPAKKG